ncbi:MAG: hypothetical protein SFV22_04355 [Saprospiraceae bacterium]|nr:hypothetical protein [Saprospiraceae bacterium]
MAKKTVAAAESSLPLEQLGEIHALFLERFNRNSVPMGEQLTTVLGLLQGLFADIQKELADDDQQLAALDALLKKLEEILRRFEGINPDELDPEKIRQKVLEALADWQAKLEADLAALSDKNAQLATRLTALETAFQALREKVDAIDFQNLDPEKIKQQVLDALAVWRSEIGNALTALQNDLRLLNNKVARLENELAALAARVQEIDPEQIRQGILSALLPWQTQINADLADLKNRLNQINSRVESLETWKNSVDSRLSGHDTDLANLQQAIEELNQLLDKIIAEGGVDPEDIKNRVLAALAIWRQTIEAQIAALDTRLDTAESALSQHLAWITTLRQQVADLLANGGNVDAEAVKQLVLAALRAWQEQIENQLRNHAERLDTHQSSLQSHTDAIIELQNRVAEILNRIPEFEVILNDFVLLLNQWEARLSTLEKELVAQVKRLDARISAIETAGVDPEEIRKIIEQEFHTWQLEIEAKFATKAELAVLQAALNALIARVDALPAGGLNAEQVKAIITAELGAWRAATDLALSQLAQRLTKVEKDLGAHETRLDNAESAIKHLKVGLVALQTKVEEMLENGINDEEIRAWVLKGLTQLRDEWEDKFNPLGKKITFLEAALDALRERLDQLPDPAALKTELLAWLDKWKKEFEQDLSGLDSKMTKGFKSMRDELDELEKRVNDLVLTGGAPADVEERIRKAIQAWEAKLRRELDAINQRNEEDRIGLLTLRTMFDGLQQRVRVLETADFGKAIRELADRVGKVEKLAKDAWNKAEDTADALEKLTKQGGLLEVIQKHLHVLSQQAKLWLKKADVDALIEAAFEDLEACKKDICEKIKSLEDGHATQEETIGELLEEDKKIREDLNQRAQELEEKIGQVGVLMTEADDELDQKIRDAEKDAKEYARDRDQALETRLDTRLDAAEQRDENLQAQIDDLQRQIDEWHPDPSGDAADRLARRCLEGRGIVCGFPVWHSRKFTLYVGPGAGVTSDGHIAKWRELTHFTHYKAFEAAADYAFFVRDECDGDTPVTWPVWRLVADKEDETQPGVCPLTPQRSADLNAPFIQDKVVLALLDAVDHPDPERVTFVLMRRNDAMAALHRKEALQFQLAQHPDTDFLFEEPFSYRDEIPDEDDLYLALRPELGLKEIPLPRFGLFLPEGCEPDELDRSNYPHPLDVNELFALYRPIVEEVFEKVEGEMRKLVKRYHRLLFPQFGEQYFSDALDVLDEKWTDYKVFCEKNALKPLEDARHFIQYFYDWARDLINAYHELRCELLQLMAECCIRNAEEHPRHLLLGLAMRVEYNGIDSPLRHIFFQPPIYNGNAARLETCRLYLRRWLLLLKGFLLPIADNPEANPVCHCDEDGEYPSLPDYCEVKITPGRSYFHPFSRQSIPFYYLVTLGTQSVHRFWEYCRTKNLTVNRHLCYHANDTEESYSALPQVIRPLHYSFDAYDFYRIEGHIAQRYTDVKGKILNKIRKYNLDFDVLEIEAKDVMTKYPAPLHFNTFAEKLQGAEHLAGVPKGGTFILVWENWQIGNDLVPMVIADFSVPYRCCSQKCGYDLSATVASRCVDGKREVTVTVTPLHLDCGKFTLLLDGKPAPGFVNGAQSRDGNYSFEKGSATNILIHVPADSKEHVIRVEGINNPCCEEIKIQSPECRGCSLEVEAVPAPNCERGMVKVELLITAENPGKSFKISINDKIENKSYRYANRGEITRVALLLPGAADYRVVVMDEEHADCMAETAFATPHCGCTMRLEIEAQELGRDEGKVRLLVHTNDPVSDKFRIMYQIGGGVTIIPQEFRFTPPSTVVDITLPIVQGSIFITAVDIQSELCRATTEFQWQFRGVD